MADLSSLVLLLGRSVVEASAAFIGEPKPAPEPRAAAVGYCSRGTRNGWRIVNSSSIVSAVIHPSISCRPETRVSPRR